MNTKTAELEDGCAAVILTYDELNEFAGRKREFKLLATVTEAVTGTKQNATAKMKFSYTHHKIVFGSSSDKHIIGGFPYVGKISVVDHDGAPVGGVNLEICSRLFTSIEKMRNEINRVSYKFYTYTEDQFVSLGKKVSKILHKSVCVEQRVKEDGTLSFAVPIYDVPRNVTKLSIKVKSLDAPANATIGILQPKAELNVALTHSNATSALTILEEEDAASMGCGTNEVSVFLAAESGSSVDISYFVSSGAALVTTGIDTVDAGTADLEAEYVGDAFMIDMGDEASRPEGTILAKHIVKIPRPFADEGKVTDTIKLLVYTRDAEGNTLSSTRDYSAESCAAQPVVNWSAEKLNPGDAAKLSISGDKNALCGYSVVDKSVDLVPNPNKVTTARLQKLKEAIAKQRIVDDQNPTGCSDANLMFRAFERLGLFVMSDTLVVNTKCDSLVDVDVNAREKQKESTGAIPDAVPFGAAGGYAEEEYTELSFYSDSADDYDAPVMAQAAPIALGAAPALATRISSSGERGGVRRKTQANRVATQTVKRNKIELRNYFPETWLFDLIDLDETGAGELQLSAPHTITTWIAEVICSSEEQGMTVSNKSSLVVTQDFFADLSMPYFVKRGEILPINISVFNNVDRGLPMKLSLRESDEFKVDASSQAVCVPASSNEIKSFVIKASELNEVNVTVEAKITDEASVECDGLAGEAEGFTDVLQKPVQVKPEGFPVEIVSSSFQCKEEGEVASQPLKEMVLPEDLVEDSERAWVMVTGDIMAPALSNLDKLLKLPTGCGEQNMMGMAPNVYLMEYLSGTGKKDVDIERKAKENMRTGYNRENSKFRHSDGSYSVWGPGTSKEGSMWLTSFVLKVFSQASKFITVDSSMLKQSKDWVLRHQMRTGCFPNKGFAVHSQIKGSDASLTASLLVTLMELKQNNDLDVSDEILDTALQCMSANVTADDTYRRVLMAYALSLYEKVYPDRKPVEGVPRSADLVEELVASANTSIAGQLYWTTEQLWNRALNVEVTAYSVLTLVMHDRLPEALKAIRWMATMRNSQGGFVSTQDTMVALQAMSHYSLKVTQGETALKLKVKGEKEEEAGADFELNEKNLLLLQRWRVPQVPAKLTMDVDGSGCFMVQTVLRYNVHESPDKNSFEATATQSEDGLVEVCASYVGSKEETDMVVIEIELLSGFVADTASLEALKNELEAPVKRFEYEEKEGKVVLYLDSMPKEKNCWDVQVTAKSKVEELKSAIVKIYDYYNQDDVVSTEYNVV